MAAYKLTVNGKIFDVEAEPDTPLLWILREWLDLTGTKFGCGVNTCGACNVLIDGRALRSCQTPVRICEGRSITTIEGLSADGSESMGRNECAAMRLLSTRTNDRTHRFTQSNQKTNERANSIRYESAVVPLRYLSSD